MIRRLSSRRVCRNCGKIYNLISNPPKVDGKCDACGGELYQRDDDRPEVIENRYDVYTSSTAPLIEFYRSRGLLVEVDGKADPDAIFARIMEIIGG